jgi:Flp pilus assembly protein TadG
MKLFGTPNCRERGQSLMELALITPVFLILALGVFDYGRVYFAYVSVTNGARTGADYASVNPTQAADLDGIRAAALTETNELLDTSASNPDVSVSPGTDANGIAYADVTVSYTFNTLVDWPGMPDSIDLERTVRTFVREE